MDNKEKEREEFQKTRMDSFIRRSQRPALRPTKAAVEEFKQHCIEVYNLELDDERAYRILFKLHQLYRLLGTR